MQKFLQSWQMLYSRKIREIYRERNKASSKQITLSMILKEQSTYPSMSACESAISLTSGGCGCMVWMKVTHKAIIIIILFIKSNLNFFYFA